MKKKREKVQISDECIEDIKYLLRNGYKVYVDKECKSEVLRHHFYKISDEFGHHFYHVRYSIMRVDKFNTRIKDYQVIDVADVEDDIESTISKITQDIVQNYLEYNDFTLSCNRKDCVS